MSLGAVKVMASVLPGSASVTTERTTRVSPGPSRTDSRHRVPGRVSPGGSLIIDTPLRGVSVQSWTSASTA